MKFLLYEIIPRAGFNLATGRFWPAGHMFDTPGIEDSFHASFSRPSFQKKALCA